MCVWNRQQMMSCGRKIMKKFFLLKMKVWAVPSQFNDIFVTCYYNNNLNILNLMLMDLCIII